jgi:hypothetical protein
MSFLEHTNKEWQKLSSKEREELLRELAASIPGYQPTWWGGISFEALAGINDLDDLPGDLCGRLIIAITKDGFSIDENRRVEETLRRS